MLLCWGSILASGTKEGYGHKKTEVFDWRVYVLKWFNYILKSSNSRRTHFNPFIPSCAPTIVVDIDHIIPNLNYLSFKPLVNSIFHINPLSDFILRLIEIERGYGFTWNDLLFFELIFAILKELKSSDILVKRFERFGDIKMRD